jgi:hypothetical protein
MAMEDDTALRRRIRALRLSPGVCAQQMLADQAGLARERPSLAERMPQDSTEAYMLAESVLPTVLKALLMSPARFCMPAIAAREIRATA